MDYSETIAEARKIATRAYREAIPNPIIVGQAKGLADDSLDMDEPVYYVSEGNCGFAWIWLPKATTAFTRWLKKQGIGMKSHDTGYTIWYSDLIEGDIGQSVERKEKAMEAVVEYLRQNEIDCYALSRLD